MLPITSSLQYGKIEDMDFEPNVQSEIVSLILAFFGGGGLITLFTTLLMRKRNNAETKLADANADSVIISSALEFVNTLKCEMVDLKKSVEALEKKIMILDDHIRVQATFITRLREALNSVKPNHPMLAEEVPILSI